MPTYLQQYYNRRSLLLIPLIALLVLIITILSSDSHFALYHFYKDFPVRHPAAILHEQQPQIFRETCQNHHHDHPLNKPSDSTNVTYDVLAEQSVRQRVFRETCLEYQLGSSRVTYNSQIFINHTGQVVYCFAPKAGCTNLKGVWYNYTGTEPRYSVHHDNYHIDIGIEKYVHYYRHKPIAGLLGYYKVAFVRHPWIRLISGYRDKLLNGEPNWDYAIEVFSTLERKECLSRGKDHWLKITREISEKTGGTGRLGNQSTDGHLNLKNLRSSCFITFEDFIDNIVKITAKQLDTVVFNRHWFPLYQLCDACFMKYDFIGKVEHIVEDFNYINHLLFDGKAYLKPPRTAIQSDLEMVKEYFADIPYESFLKLLPVYYFDFALFGYDPLHGVLYPDCRKYNS